MESNIREPCIIAFIKLIAKKKINARQASRFISFPQFVYKSNKTRALM